MIREIGVDGTAHLVEIFHQDSFSSLDQVALVVRHNNAGQDAYDGHDDQQLDQRKTPL